MQNNQYFMNCSRDAANITDLHIVGWIRLVYSIYLLESSILETTKKSIFPHFQKDLKFNFQKYHKCRNILKKLYCTYLLVEIRCFPFHVKNCTYKYKAQNPNGNYNSNNQPSVSLLWWSSWWNSFQIWANKLVTSCQLWLAKWNSMSNISYKWKL